VTEKEKSKRIALTLHPKQMLVYQSEARFRVVVAGRRWGKCLASGTRISMTDGGTRLIENVRVGDEVLTLNEETLAIETRRVLNRLDNGVRDTVTIDTAARGLCSTPNHPHLVNGKWKHARHVRPGDLIAVPRCCAEKTGWSRDLVSDDLVWEPVVSCRNSGTARTWDLSIEGNHNFVANGVVTHNTALSRVLIIKMAQVSRRKIWYVAPTYRMAKKIMWRDLQEALPKQWIRKINETTLMITLVNGTIIELLGADKPDSLRGVGIHFLVLDEFQDISEETWTEVLRPTLADTGGHAIFIGCVKGDTRVLPRGGMAEIDTFSRNSPDRTLDPMKKDFYGLGKTFHEANGFWNNGVVPTRRMVTNFGFELEASLPHPVWVMGESGIPEWRRFAALKVGDHVAVDRGMEVWGGHDPLEGWSERVAGLRGKKGGAALRTLGVTHMTEDLAYFLGLWIAEGSFRKGVDCIMITGGDSSVGEFLTSGRVGIRFDAMKNRSDQWRCNAKELVELMCHVGMPPVRSSERRIPGWVAQGRREWAQAFIAGMWDGDGHCSSGRVARVGYDSASRGLIRDLQLLMTNFGIIGKVTTTENPPGRYAGKSSVLHHYTVHGVGVTRFAETISLRIARKAEVLAKMKLPGWSRLDGVPCQKALLERVREGLPRGDPVRKISRIAIGGYRRQDSKTSYRSLENVVSSHACTKDSEAFAALAVNLEAGYFWDEIVALEDGSAKTYDFTIPETCSFWSNGFISHNTPRAYNHLYDLYMLGQDETNRALKRWESWQFATSTSPFVPESELRAARKDMDEKSYLQEFEACHLPDTKVLMFDGTARAVRDIKPGDLVTHAQDDGSHVPVEVLDVGETGVKTICDVTLETGEIVSASERHRFKVCGGTDNTVRLVDAEYLEFVPTRRSAPVKRLARLDHAWSERHRFKICGGADNMVRLDAAEYLKFVPTQRSAFVKRLARLDYAWLRVRYSLSVSRAKINGWQDVGSFDEWCRERWDGDRRVLRLRVEQKTFRPEPVPVWNLLVGSRDHSYLLASGANNFNSFETMTGRVYYPFDRNEHVGEFPFDARLPVWVGMDFNIDPMSTVILQPQPSGEVWAVDEVVLFSSNTQEACAELDKRLWRYQHQTTVYPDPAGGQRQHARGETDLDILRECGFRRLKYRRKHPSVIDRINAVNRMLCAADGTVRLRVDRRCRHLVESFEQTIYKPGSREVNKTPGIEHSADACGYCIELEYPVRRIEFGGLSL
jgi:intein/homing endonuclease